MRYYKTKSGYYYKEYKNGKKKRISNKKYNKNINQIILKRGGNSNQNDQLNKVKQQNSRFIKGGSNHPISNTQYPLSILLTLFCLEINYFINRQSTINLYIQPRKIMKQIIMKHLSSKKLEINLTYQDYNNNNIKNIQEITGIESNTYSKYHLLGSVANNKKGLKIIYKIPEDLDITNIEHNQTLGMYKQGATGYYLLDIIYWIKKIIIL